MAGLDQYTDRYFNELPNYKCPICRNITLIPFYRRPLNQSLNSICENFPEYESRLEEIEDIDAKDREKYVDSEFDIAKLAQTERKRIAKKLYDDILPLLVEAARKGSSAIVISCPGKVNSISRVIDLFSGYLFKHKIFRIIATKDEVTISILRQRAIISNEYVNPDMDSTNSTQSTFVEEDYLPPSRYAAPMSRITRAVDRLSLSDFRTSATADFRTSATTDFRTERATLPVIAPRRLLEE